MGTRHGTKDDPITSVSRISIRFFSFKYTMHMYNTQVVNPAYLDAFDEDRDEAIARAMASDLFFGNVA